MTHDETYQIDNFDELLAEIDRYLVPTLAESEIGNKAIGILKALRAVVELHKPFQIRDEILCEGCCQHTYLTDYPCPTIQARKKELG